jgi:hypothetical protein
MARQARFSNASAGMPRRGESEALRQLTFLSGRLRIDLPVTSRAVAFQGWMAHDFDGLFFVH